MFYVCAFIGNNVTLPNCIIIPINPSYLPAGGGINNGTSNVTIQCNCISTGPEEIRWYSPDGKEITDNYVEALDTPYVVQQSGILMLPIFNKSHQGTYYCGVGKNPMIAASINLTLWAGMFVYYTPFPKKMYMYMTMICI